MCLATLSYVITEAGVCTRTIPKGFNLNSPGWSEAEPGVTMGKHPVPEWGPMMLGCLFAPFGDGKFWATPGSASLHPGLFKSSPLRGLSIF